MIIGKVKKITIILLTVVFTNLHVLIAKYDADGPDIISSPASYYDYKKDGNLKILTYNIHMGKNIDDKNTIDEMIKFLKESNVDVICLQEVLPQNHLKMKDISQVSSEYIINSRNNFVWQGLATYSKYPMVESNHILLSSKGQQRGFLHTVYYIDGRLVNVINTHLGLDRKERRMQIREIKNYIINLNGETILVGDFNEDYFYIDNYVDIGKYHGCENQPTFKFLTSRIDYIFIASRGVYSSNYKIIKKDMSDHYPVMTNIRYMHEQ